MLSSYGESRGGTHEIERTYPNYFHYFTCCGSRRLVDGLRRLSHDPHRLCLGDDVSLRDSGRRLPIEGRVARPNKNASARLRGRNLIVGLKLSVKPRFSPIRAQSKSQQFARCSVQHLCANCPKQSTLK